MSSSLSRNQRKLVQRLQQFTGATFRQAAEALKGNGWNLEVAADTIFEQNGDVSDSDEEPQISAAKLEQFFEAYEDSEQKGKMLAEGLMKFCNDLNVDPEDAVLLVISEYMGAANMLEYSKEEFLRGMTKLRCENIDQLRQKLDSLREELDQDQRFKEVYLYTHSFAKAKGQKSMFLEVAIPLWKILLKGRFKLLDEWCRFIEKTRTHAITKDEWTLLLEFVTKVNDDLSKFDENGAWPVVIDDFVVFAKKQQCSQSQ